MQRFAITGADGFVGRHVTRALREAGFAGELRFFDGGFQTQSENDAITLDLAAPKAAEQVLEGIDGVINLSAMPGAQAEADPGGLRVVNRDLPLALDVLVCNAGVPGPAGPMQEASAHERERLFAINLHHPLLLSGLLAPAMAQRGGGSIVLLSSIAGLRGNAAIGLFGLTKAAVSQLARNLAAEWGPRGVRANAIAPGLVNTDWAQAIIGDAAAEQRRMQQTPLHRTAQPREIASVALFLNCEASSFITGQTSWPDGGTYISDGN